MTPAGTKRTRPRLTPIGNGFLVLVGCFLCASFIQHVNLLLLAAALIALSWGWYRMSRDPSSRAPFLSVIAVALIDVVFLLISGLNLD